MLNAFNFNQDIARGEFVAKHLQELEPNKLGNYVLLSNFDATVRRWDSIDYLRDIMRKKGLTEKVGSSRVTVKCYNESGIIRENRITEAFF